MKRFTTVWRLSIPEIAGRKVEVMAELPFNRLSTEDEARQVNTIFAKCRMKGAAPEFLLDKHADRLRTYFVAKRKLDGRVVGTVAGVNHVAAFNDPEQGPASGPWPWTPMPA